MTVLEGLIEQDNPESAAVDKIRSAALLDPAYQKTDTLFKLVNILIRSSTEYHLACCCYSA